MQSLDRISKFERIKNSREVENTIMIFKVAH